MMSRSFLGLCVCLGVLTVTTACDSEKAPAPTPPWPEWVLHHWVWEDESSQESAIALVDGYLERDIPVGAIIIDSPWATGYSTFEFSRGRFPDPQGMVDYFHSRGVRVLLWTVSAINVDETALYDYAAERGYFMQTSASSGPAVINWWKGKGSLIDYFNPEAIAWWHGLVDIALELGIDGWKTDGLDFSAWLAPYSPGLQRTIIRNEYSEVYYRDFFDYTRQRLGKDRLIMSRPVDNYGLDLGGRDVAFTPVEITWAGWVGDQDPTFAGLRNALNNLYYSSEMGYVITGSDIGGYRSKDGLPNGRDKEPFVRWAQLGAFCPLMENGGSGEHRPWEFDAETEDIYRRFVDLHMRLIPYLTEHGARSVAAGEPLMRFVSKSDYSYLLGPDIFVAPMLDSGTSRTVSLPAGADWDHLFGDQATYAGGQTMTLPVPLAEFPVFVRSGSLVAKTLQSSL